MRGLALLLFGATAGCSLIDDFGRFESHDGSLVEGDLAPGADDGATVGDGPPARDPDLAGLDGPLDGGAADLTTDGASRPDLACAPGCVGKDYLCVPGLGLVPCLLGCLPTDAELEAHCALVPTGGDLCGGKYLPATVLPPGTYFLDANPNNNNQPWLHNQDKSISIDGRLAANRATFCFEALAQSGIQPVAFDTTTIGYKTNSAPFALIARTTLELTNVVIWAGGADGVGANGSGLGRNGGYSGAPAAKDAPPLQGGGFGGTSMMGMKEGAGGGGGGSSTGGPPGGVGGAGTQNGLGGKAGSITTGLVGGGGGGGGGDATNGGAGGAGGGIVQLAAGLKLRFGGAIYATGGRGAHGAPPKIVMGLPGGGGGGGAGGAVLLEAPLLEFLGNPCAQVSGGGGGSGASAVANGAGGSYVAPTTATCPLLPVAASPPQGGGAGGAPAITTLQGHDPAGQRGALANGAGGGGAGGPGTLHLRMLKTLGNIDVQVFPPAQSTRILDKY